MAKTKKEEVVKSTTEKVVEETTQQEQPKEETPKVDLSKFKSKDDDSVIKVDLSKKPEENETKEEVVEDNTDDTGVVELVEDTDTSQKQEEVQSETETQETPIVEEITGEEVKEVEELTEQIEEAVTETEATGKPLPENIQKLMDFMEETGGDLEDYVRLNQDISKLDDNTVLLEYYKQTKPHLTTDEINFLMEDTFSYDEEMDDDRDVKRKKLALKEQVASARTYLDGQKSKHYEEIKAGSKLTPEQQKAIDFFNRYNKESEVNNKKIQSEVSVFNKRTEQVFNDKFKGFEYNVGDKKFRFNVKDSEGVKNTQSDINNFVRKFLNKDGFMEDAKGYHKSLYTAMNADAVAQHFYEQGKADALKESVAKSKNINMDPRQSQKTIEAGGVKVRVLGNDSSDFKFKIKNNK